jgi:hypothetical protein
MNNVINTLILRLVWGLFCLRHQIWGVKLGFRAQLTNKGKVALGTYGEGWVLIARTGNPYEMLLTLLHEAWHARQDRVWWPMFFGEMELPIQHGRYLDGDTGFQAWLEGYPEMDRPSEMEAEVWARHLACTSYYWAVRLLR